MYSIAKDTHPADEPAAAERKEFFCTFCKAEWTMMEVLDKSNSDGFQCHRCNRTLKHDPERNQSGHEQSTRLNNQLKFITDLLAKIDSSHVPESSFDDAFSRARPVVRDASHPASGGGGLDSSLASHSLESVQARPTAVRGLVIGPATMAVSITTADGPSEAERQAEREKKEKAAKANALPSWMAHSTVTGESYSGTSTNTAALAAIAKSENKDEVVKDSKGDVANAKEQADMDDYFARLKREAALELVKKNEEEDNDDDDEVDFEDVAVVAPGVATLPVNAGMRRLSPEDGADDVDRPQMKKVRTGETMGSQSAVSTLQSPGKHNPVEGTNGHSVVAKMEDSFETVITIKEETNVAVKDGSEDVKVNLTTSVIEIAAADKVKKETVAVTDLDSEDEVEFEDV